MPFSFGSCSLIRHKYKLVLCILLGTYPIGPGLCGILGNRAFGIHSVANVQESPGAWDYNSYGWVWSGVGSWSQGTSGLWTYCWPQYTEHNGIGWSWSCGANPPPVLVEAGLA